MTRPPRLVEAVLGRLLPRDDRAEILGDLAERWADRVARHGPGIRSRLWYTRQAVALLVWLVISRVGPTDVRTLELVPALRRLARSPGFTSVAVLSLALGIGANTTVFGVLRVLLYTPLEVERPDELRMIYHARPDGFDGVTNYGSSQTADPETGGSLHSNVSYPLYEALRRAAGPGLEIAGFSFLRQVAVVVADQPALAATGKLASGEYFSTLGVRMALGRPLLPSDDDPSAPLVAVISHGFWHRAFGADPSVVGRPMLLNGVRAEVVGVTAEGFDGLSPGGFFPRTEVTAPLAAQPILQPRWTPPDGSLFASANRYWIRVLGRVTDSEEAAGRVEAMGAALRAGFLQSGVVTGDPSATRVRLLDGSRGLDSLRSETERPLAILTGIAGLVLLVACANVATLLLARGHTRRREMAVRKALGGRRGQVAWPLLLECLVVTLAGAGLGVALAVWGTGFVGRALTAGLGAGSVAFELDLPLLLATAGIALAAALGSGLLPAVRASAVPPFGSLGSRGAGADGRSWIGRGLVVTQIAVSVPLVVGAGLLVRSVGNLASVDPGFDPDGLAVFALDPSLVTSERREAERIFDQVLARVRQTPGVRSATLIENVLLSGWTSGIGIEVEGERTNILMNAVGPDFLATMGIPLVEGRELGADDDAAAEWAVMINRSAADRLFGGRALGRTFLRDGREVRVVGVVADTRYQSLRSEAAPTMFDPWSQRTSLGRLHVAVRAPGVAWATLEPRLHAAVAEAHAGLPVTEVRTQVRQLEDAMRREAVFAELLSLFGGFVLLLAYVGLHGVTSYSVSRRMPEMGVRLALGARPRGLLGMVVRQVLILTSLGLAAGLAVSWIATPVLGSLLYGLEPSDPLTFGAAAAAMGLVAVIAASLPAWRAATTDPLRTLGAE